MKRNNIVLFIILTLFIIILVITSCQKSQEQAETTQIKKEVVSETPPPTQELLSESAKNQTPEEQQVNNPPQQEQQPADNTSQANEQVPLEVISTEPKTHTVEIANDGFKPKTLTIKVGETVVWKNIRTSGIKKFMIVGNTLCREIRSEQFNPGQSYQWTFNQAKVCTIVDGVITTHSSTITIEE